MNRTKYTVYLDKRQIAVMREVQRRTGVTVAEQIRRAIASAIKGKS